MKFAYLIMGSHYDPERDRASIGGGSAQIIGVPDLDAACEVARRLVDEGIDDIEECGACKRAGADRLVEATGGRVAISYAVNHPDLKEHFARLFGE